MIRVGILGAAGYTGGELINIYYEYLGSHDPQSLELLRLHNYEDVLGMTELLPVLSYRKVIEDISADDISDAAISPFTSYDGHDKNELIVTIKNKYTVPKPISVRDDDFYCSIASDRTVIRVEILEGELRHFYSDYKNYYYLPKEDMAIHKSVATFVDNQYRERCKAYNCYVRKSGTFIIQYDTIMQPDFRKEVKDRHSYFLLTDDFLNSKQMVASYVKHIIHHLFKL